MSTSQIAKSDLFVSVVTTVRNGADYIAPFVSQLAGILDAELKDYEIVLVDNCSTDDTVRLIRDLQSNCKNLQLYCLGAPLQREMDILVGIEQSIGDAVITIDARSDPPETISEFIRKFQSGFEIVYGVRDDRIRPSRLYDRLSRRFFRLYQGITGVPFPPGASSYRLISRRVVNTVLQNPDRYELFPVIAAIPGFPFAEIVYGRRPESRDERQGYLSGFGRALRILLLGSQYPLRMLTFLALIGALLSLLYSFYVVGTLLMKRTAEGWATLSLQVSGLFLLVFIILAVMSEYIYRLFSFQQNRSPYFIAQENTSHVFARKAELNVTRGQSGGTE